ncbi:MAG: CpaF family protein, partial [Alphaproteobacteria bacterium]
KGSPAPSKENGKDSKKVLETAKPDLGGGLKPKGAKAAPSSAKTSGREIVLEKLTPLVEKKILAALPPKVAGEMPQSAVSEEIHAIIKQATRELKVTLSEEERKGLHSYLLNEYFAKALDRAAAEAAKEGPKKAQASENVLQAKDQVYSKLMDQIDATAAMEIPRSELAEQVSDVVGEILVQEKINLNLKEQKELVKVLMNDMLGLGPLEPLLEDESITDIMVNGFRQVYIEQGGKLVLTDVVFKDERHLMNIATRIVTAVGRRVDESSPICDARLADGSRVNVIIPPLAIDGASISIRKFAKQKITLDKMIEQNNISSKMGTILKIAGASQLNILISGGTGSGKTTLLNAISKTIDHGERIVTIEDAAELQLQQPHVVRLETRPANLEGDGEIDMRGLVKNSLRMRPDRIIVGEIRGIEAVDMLQAMNTGHDGSLGTIHANSPREALTRLENMVGMAGINLPTKAVRTQIADALDLVVQVSRMRDGMRRVVSITEIVGMEGEVITSQELYKYKYTGEDQNGLLLGEFNSTGLRPHFLAKAEYFGLGRPLMMAMG